MAKKTNTNTFYTNNVIVIAIKKKHILQNILIVPQRAGFVKQI